MHPWFPLLVLALVSSCVGCSKARGDDFSRFRASEELLETGKDPRKTLRYRPTPGKDVVYQLKATRRAGANKLPSRMGLRVALTFPSQDETTQFGLRLLTVLRLDPTPHLGLPDPGPTHLLLGGRLGPRGALDRLEESTELQAPVNLTLLAPLLLTTFPEAAVGVGAVWKVSRRLDWSRREGADRLLGRNSGFDGHTEVILATRYTLVRESTPGDDTLVHLEGATEARIRSRTTTLSHTTLHDGTAKGTVWATLDRGTGLPESVTVSLDGTYRLRADDQTSKVTERIQVSLTRE